LKTNSPAKKNQVFIVITIGIDTFAREIIKVKEKAV